MARRADQKKEKVMLNKLGDHGDTVEPAYSWSCAAINSKNIGQVKQGRCRSASRYRTKREKKSSRLDASR